jgi:CRISPR-associated protein Csx3
MAEHYKVEKVSDNDGVVEIRVSFGVPAQNPQIVRDAVAAIRVLNLTGGKLIKFNGPSSIPVAMALAHAVAHLFGAVAYFDPKLSPGYVVCITHGPEFELGEQLP